MFIQLVKLAKFGTNHDRHFANVNSNRFFFRNHILHVSFSFTSLRTINEIVVKFFLAEGHIDVDVSSVGQISEPSLMRKYNLIRVVGFVGARRPRHMQLAKLDLVHQIFVRVKLMLPHGVLGHHVNLNGPILTHHILNLILYKPIETLLLLGDESVLLEVRPNHRPGIFSIYRSQRIYKVVLVLVVASRLSHLLLLSA